MKHKQRRTYDANLKKNASRNTLISKNPEKLPVTPKSLQGALGRMDTAASTGHASMSQRGMVPVPASFQEALGVNNSHHLGTKGRIVRVKGKTRIIKPKMNRFQGQPRLDEHDVELTRQQHMKRVYSQTAIDNMPLNYPKEEEDTICDTSNWPTMAQRLGGKR